MTVDDEKSVTTAPGDSTEARRKLALLKAVGLDRVPPEQRELALAIARRYDLDLMLKHLILVEGRPYITRDGLLHIAHRSGQLDGIEATEPVLENGFWRATASVYRKDMTRPFRYYGRYPEKGKNKDYGPEMATKVAESMALRRAFDISAPTIDEQWDRDMPEAPVAPPPASLRERVEQRRAEVAGPARAEEPTAEPAAPIVERWDKDLPTDSLGVPIRPAAPIVEDDSEPEAILADPMTVEASEALPAVCLAEDAALDTGPCEQPAGHFGPHKNSGGVWPNR